MSRNIFLCNNSDCIPKNVPADYVNGDILPQEKKKKGGGGGFLIAEHSSL